MKGRSVNLSSAFLEVVRRASTDLDINKIRVEVREFSAKHPELSIREKGRRMVDLTARKAAALGAVASLPPGWAVVAAAGPELAGLVVMQSRLIVGLHILYGREPDPDERALEILAGLGAGAGIHIGRRLTARAAEEVAARIITRLAGRQLSHMIPIAGALAAAGLNYWAVQAMGRAMLRRIERVYGPPGLGGKGPVIEVSGKIE